MIEMEMENERVKRLHLQQWGEGWIQAIMAGTLDKLERFCRPDINSTLLTPKRSVTFTNAVDLVAKYHEWFDDCTNFNLEESRISQVGERLGIFYRFRLETQGDWYAIEQQLYCTLKEGRVEKLQLLCSGFQLIGVNYQPAAADALQAEGHDPVRDELLELYTGASDAASTCAVLTPAIKSKLRGMQTGQVLEVRVDDPSAKGDIEAWCRLSGNELLKVIEDEKPELRFFVKKK